MGSFGPKLGSFALKLGSVWVRFFELLLILKDIVGSFVHFLTSFVFALAAPPGRRACCSAGLRPASFAAQANSACRRAARQKTSIHHISILNKWGWLAGADPCSLGSA